MSARFGRNKRRRLREVEAQAAGQSRALTQATTKICNMQGELRRFRERDERVRSAPVRLDLSSLDDFREAAMKIHASLTLRDGRDFYIAEAIDERRFRVNEKREQFVVDVSRALAELIFEHATRRWGARLDSGELLRLLLEREERSKPVRCVMASTTSRSAAAADREERHDG